MTEGTHKVAALRTFVYPAPDIKAPPIFWLSFGATVNCAKVSGDFLEIGRSRFLFARHVVETDHMDSDYVAVAKRFVGTPYLWGGRQSLGLDCSALVQLALTSAGLVCPRDTDMQEAELGEPLPDPQDVLSFRRGDLLFWPGHVAILAEIGQLLHANAYHMETVIEPLDLALSRIEKAHAGLHAVKRIGSGPEVQ
jgi:cell wall-associated NlpC family hydrolase